MLSLFFVNLDSATTSSLNRLVAVRLAASAEAAFHLTGKASMGLFSQVIEIKFIDQSPGDPHHLAPTGIGVVAVSGADDADAAMLKPLDHAFGFADFAAETVQPLKDEHGEATGQSIGEQRLAAWPKGHGDAAADSFI